MNADTMGAVATVAARLMAARAEASPIAPVRHMLPAFDIDAAYAVQRAIINHLCAGGARIVGRKIGLTSKAVQAQLGVDQPDFGILLDSMAHFGDDVDVPLAGLIAPRIEAEIAFVLGRDIDTPNTTPAALAGHISQVAVAAEIVDSAIAGWDINIVDTIADNASSGAFVLGSRQDFRAGMDLAGLRMRLLRDGVEVSSGTGAASLGSPLNALAWLADTALRVGAPLRAGDIILAGALGPMVLFAAQTYDIEIDSFARLTVRGMPCP